MAKKQSKTKSTLKAKNTTKTKKTVEENVYNRLHWTFYPVAAVAIGALYLIVNAIG